MATLRISFQIKVFWTLAKALAFYLNHHFGGRYRAGIQNPYKTLNLKVLTMIATPYDK